MNDGDIFSQIIFDESVTGVCPIFLNTLYLIFTLCPQKWLAAGPTLLREQ